MILSAVIKFVKGILPGKMRYGVPEKIIKYVGNQYNGIVKPLELILKRRLEQLMK
jgi:hypothetical protein